MQKASWPQNLRAHLLGKWFWCALNAYEILPQETICESQHLYAHDYFREILLLEMIQSTDSILIENLSCRWCCGMLPLVMRSRHRTWEHIIPVILSSYGTRGLGDWGTFRRRMSILQAGVYLCDNLLFMCVCSCVPWSACPSVFDFACLGVRVHIWIRVKECVVAYVHEWLHSLILASELPPLFLNPGFTVRKWRQERRQNIIPWSGCTRNGCLAVKWQERLSWQTHTILS